MRDKSVSTGLLVSAFVLLAVFSGCSAKASISNEKAGIPPAAPSGLNDENTCSIEGIVVDDEVNPVAGAKVGLLEVPEENTVSAENGQFSFSYLDPQAYSVAVTKLGYKSALKAAVCEAGQKHTGFQVDLPKIPDPQTSYSRIITPQKGRIACSFGHYALATSDQCKERGIDANGKTVFQVPTEPYPITAAVYELQWVQSSGLFGGKYLQLAYPAYKSKQVETVTDDKLRTGSILTGQSPLNLHIKALDQNDPLYQFNANVTMTFEVRAAGSTGPADEDTSKLVVGQEFTLYVALFYLGEPIPQQFTMLE